MKPEGAYTLEFHQITQNTNEALCDWNNQKSNVPKSWQHTLDKCQADLPLSVGPSNHLMCMLAFNCLVLLFSGGCLAEAFSPLQMLNTCTLVQAKHACVLKGQ